MNTTIKAFLDIEHLCQNEASLNILFVQFGSGAAEVFRTVHKKGTAEEIIAVIVRECDRWLPNSVVFDVSQADMVILKYYFRATDRRNWLKLVPA